MVMLKFLIGSYRARCSSSTVTKKGQPLSYYCTKDDEDVGESGG